MTEKMSTPYLRRKKEEFGHFKTSGTFIFKVLENIKSLNPPG